MKYFRVEDKIQDLNNLYQKGFEKGTPTGWKAVDEVMTIKKGYPIFVAGAPHSGKTEFVLELMLSLSQAKGWKWFVYTGEIGSVTELVAELCYKLIGKPYAKREIHGTAINMSESDKTYSEMFISQHFYFLDTEDIKSEVSDFTVTDFYKIVADTEMELGIVFDGTLIDPWNDVVNETLSFGGREDLWLADALKTVRRDSKAKNRINIVINHIADVKPMIDSESKRRFFPVALPSEWAGGRTWWRRAYLMLLIYRPPVFLNDENGFPHLPNESHIIVQKAKPKGIARLGIAKLFWDWKTNRYYETPELTGSPFVKEAKQIQPNIDFDNKVKLNDDEGIPF
jgi:hypothetical protein